MATVRISDEHAAKLSAIARQRGTTVSAAFRDAVDGAHRQAFGGSDAGTPSPPPPSPPTPDQGEDPSKTAKALLIVRSLQTDGGLPEHAMGWLAHAEHHLTEGNTRHLQASKDAAAAHAEAGRDPKALNREHARLSRESDDDTPEKKGAKANPLHGSVKRWAKSAT